MSEQPRPQIGAERAYAASDPTSVVHRKTCLAYKVYIAKVPKLIAHEHDTNFKYTKGTVNERTVLNIHVFKIK